MRVVVQNGEYWLCNNGDLAMLEVTVGRLRELWPDATIGVATSAPSLLRAFHPGVAPISGRRGEWPRRGPVARLAERAGPGVVGGPSVAWLSAREHPRQLVQRIRGGLRRRFGSDDAEPNGGSPALTPLPGAMNSATLVLAMGGGYFADVDAGQVHRTLRMLEFAAAHGIPSAMVGQGLGPLEDPALVQRAATVLPRVDLIALREKRRGPALLDALGVPSEQVVITGDDAVELAHGLRRPELGTGLGVCLRVAGYSPVAARAAESIGRVVRGFAAAQAAPLLPLIISEYRSEDRRSTLPLVAGYPHTVRALPPHAGPRATAERVGQCRVLVTGAYHLGVFALSQGIPVIGLTSSRYYDDKFLGLNDMFGGTGLELVRLDEPDLEDHLEQAVRSAWEHAPEVREPLRTAARDQIARSRGAYDRLAALVTG